MNEMAHGGGKKRRPKRGGAKQYAKSPGSGPSRSGTPRICMEHSAGVVLFRAVAGGRVYLILDYGKHWDYAKGHLEKGETPWQAAVRELSEETGITQVRRVGRFQQDMHYEFYSPRKGLVRKRVTFFLAETSEEIVCLSQEHVGYAWLPLAEALARLTFPNARTLLAEAAASAPETLSTEAPVFSADSHEAASDEDGRAGQRPLR